MQEEEKKALKKSSGRVGRGLIFYTLILYAVVFVGTVYRAGSQLARLGGLEQMSAEEQELFVQSLTEGGSSMILAVLIGVLFLWLLRSRETPVKKMMETKKQMTARTFMKLLAVFMTAQLVFTFASNLMEAGLNLIGYSAMESIEAATDNAATFSMFLYGALIGPVAEELIYRGFVLEPFRKYGKVLAIVVSAVLFGVMHGNLPQAVFAVFAGFVFGYTAVEYSMIWTIALHVVNNFVFGELMSRDIWILDEILTVVYFGLGIAGVIILWKKRGAVRDYIAENRPEKGSFRIVFTRVSIVLFIIGNLLVGISMLTPLA